LSEKFKDTPSAKEVKNMYKALYLFKGLLSEEEKKELEKLKPEIQDIINTIDKYNEIFSDNFWIAHESISLDVMKKAIEIKETKDINTAEDYISKHYEELFEKLHDIVLNTKHFNIRKKLFIKAYEDYLNQRYYASIPIFLMLTDGIVSDLKGTGLAAQNTDYNVWDSISGLDTGMKKVAQIYNRMRTKTNDDPIYLPYRNGILHGKDLNYANYFVATKCLALVLYIFDWIREVENEPLKKEKYKMRQEKYKNMTSGDLFKMIKEHKEKQDKHEKLIEEWEKERRTNLKINEPNIELLEENTPEYNVVNFFEYISENNYGCPVKFLPAIIKDDQSKGKLAGNLNNWFEDFNNIRILKLKVDDVGAARSIVNILLYYEYQQHEYHYQKDLLVNYEVEGVPDNRLVGNGSWVIMQLGGLALEMKNKGTKIE